MPIALQTELRYARKSQRLSHGFRRQTSFIEDLGTAVVRFRDPHSSAQKARRRRDESP
jgi:hypothetical protein